MTKDDLRELFKREFEHYVALRNKQSDSKHIARPESMRVCYDHARCLLAYKMPVGPENRVVLTRFVRAGDLYYHAKKHGIQSAILFKLSRD